MSEYPILFSTQMVRDVDAGSKTHSRRIVRLPYKTCGRVYGETWDYVGDKIAREEIQMLVDAISDPGVLIRSPYGKPGDRLWVRESFATRQGGPFVYRADCESDDDAAGNLKRKFNERREREE